LPFSGVVPNVIEDHVRGNGRLDRTLQTHLPCASNAKRSAKVWATWILCSPDLSGIWAAPAT